MGSALEIQSWAMLGWAISPTWRIVDPPNPLFEGFLEITRMNYQSLLHKFQPDIPVSKCFMEYFTNIYDTNQPTMTIPKTSGGNPWRNPLKTDSKSTGYGFLLTDLLSSRIFFFSKRSCLFEEDQDQFQSCDVTTWGGLVVNWTPEV